MERRVFGFLTYSFPASSTSNEISASSLDEALVRALVPDGDDRLAGVHRQLRERGGADGAVHLRRDDDADALLHGGVSRLAVAPGHDAVRFESNARGKRPRIALDLGAAALLHRVEHERLVAQILPDGGARKPRIVRRDEHHMARIGDLAAREAALTGLEALIHNRKLDLAGSELPV